MKIVHNTPVASSHGVYLLCVEQDIESDSQRGLQSLIRRIHEYKRGTCHGFEILQGKP